MTELPVHPYIARTLELKGSWINPAPSTNHYNHHLLPTLNDPSWEKMFATSNETQRKNLAAAWMWAYGVKKSRDEFDKYGKNKDWCVERCASFIKQIEPYIPTTDHSEQDLLAETVARLLFRHDSVDSYPELKRKLWFGDEQTQQSTLLEVGNEHIYASNIAREKVLHNRIWEIARLPSSTLDHKKAAAYISAVAAINYVPTTPAIDDEFYLWYLFGDFCENGPPSYPNKETQFKRVFDYIKSQPSEFTLTVFTNIVHLQRATNGRLLALSYYCESIGVEPFDDNNMFEIYSTWFPDLSKQWEVSQTLGLTLSEAVSYALSTMQTGLTQSNDTLPNDLVTLV